MKTAVLSDIHSNIDALEAVVGDAKQWGAERFLVAGDIVGYGAAPDQCVELLRDLDAQAIAGNHDWGVVEKTSIATFNEAARQAIAWTRNNILDSTRDYLAGLPISYTEGEISLTHANFIDPGGWGYVFTLYEAQRQFKNFSTAIGVIGHSHVPFIFRMLSEDGWGDQANSDSVTWEDGERLLVNDGSVGQPRDGDPRACYVQIDSQRCILCVRRVAYDIGKAAQRIRSAGLPEYLAVRLTEGR